MSTMYLQSVIASIAVAMKSALAVTKQKADNFLVECDGWFLVLMAVLLTIAVAVATALAVWCVVYQGKAFTGNWDWYKWGVSVKAECV